MSLRPIHPAQSSASDSSKSTGKSGTERKEGNPARRTRVTPKDVTTNACIQCKKARTKCDGKQPCFRCYQRNEGAICEYRVHVKMAKEEIVERFAQLAEQYRWAHRIMKALISDNHAPGIVERLKRGEDYGSVARSFQNTRLKEMEFPISSSIPELNEVGRAESMDYEVESTAERVSRTTFSHDDLFWTKTTGDAELVNHLLELYFTWVHPIHMVLSEPHFRASYNGHDVNYCSAALLNVICAMACHLLETTDEESDFDALSDESLGTRFMDEGRSSIKPEDHNRLTTIQAFAIMFLHDAGSGKALKASSYIRFASTSLNDTSFRNEVHRDAWQITLWGVHSLNVAWTEFTYDGLDSPRLLNKSVLDGVRLDREEGRWRHYRRLEDIHTSPQASMSLLTSSELAKFLQIVQDTNFLYYDQRTSFIGARDILIQYKKYQAWKDELPQLISKVDMNSGPLPHVFFLHIHYHTAMVSLFRPLVGVEHFTGSMTQVDPESLAMHNAQEGLVLLKQYQTIFTCRYQPQLQMLCLIHLADFLVRFGDPRVAQEAALFCLESLKESRVGYAVCGPLQELFRRTLIECGIPILNELAEAASPVSDFCLDEVMDACTRLSYTQPVEHIRRRLAPSVAENWDREMIRLRVPSPDSSTSSSRRYHGDNDKLMQIRSILNGDDGEGERQKRHERERSMIG